MGHSYGVHFDVCHVKSIVEPQMSPDKTSTMLQHRLAVALACNHLRSALIVLYNYHFRLTA